nr:hypothetical protein [Melioribacteraceae bacterium]
DRTSILYIHNLNENTSNGVMTLFSLWDIKYRISNYTNESDYFSFTGKLGLQGVSAYIHFGPQIKFYEFLFINTTLGIYAGFLGIGLISETELGIRKYILDELYFEGVLSYQVFSFNFSNYEYFPSLRIGLGLDL